MFYTIYKTENLINHKIYIGKHQTNNLNDGYLGSGKFLEKAITKYGKENFLKEILFIFDNEDEMNNKEKEIVSESFIANNKNYNAMIGGEGGPAFKRKHTEETKLKISQKIKGRKLSKEHKQKITEANKKRRLSDETKKKLSIAAKQRMTSEIERKRISDSLKKYHCGV